MSNLQTTIAEHYVIEPGNMSRYELIFFTYNSAFYDRKMCGVTWLNRCTGGKTFVWPYGNSVYGSYATEKSGINEGDIAPILKDIERRYPGSIKVCGLDAYDENGCWISSRVNAV